MRLWFDTEFIEDGHTIDLLSIGVVRDDGATLYLESSEADRTKANPWVRANVLPHLYGPAVSRAQIASQLVEFAGPGPEWWAYFAAYDWVVMCQLFGTMMDLPETWPMYCRDVQQLADELGVDLESVIAPPDTAHNALSDALWTRQAWTYLRGRSASDISSA